MEVTCGKDGNRQKPEEAKLTVSKLSGHVNSSVMGVLTVKRAPLHSSLHEEVTSSYRLDECFA